MSETKACWIDDLTGVGCGEGVMQSTPVLVVVFLEITAMADRIVAGRFEVTKKYYRSKDGRHFFNFKFDPCDGHVDIYCTAHPPLNGRDPDATKTHLFSSGKLCFVSGSEPQTQQRAEELAAQWADYFLEYRRTGVTQS